MTDHTAEPANNGEPDPTERGDDVNSGTVQQDMATGSQLQVRNPYDTVVPETLRERIAYARAMAQAGILPRDYQAKPANVLVAGEMGRELGLSTVQSVLMLNVVEGRPQLGASGVRAVVLNAGHHMGPAAITYSKHGVPVEATVEAQRYRDGEPVGQPTVLSWNIARAHRAGLCTVKRDDDGEVTEVRARSQHGKVLPWEAFTEDMLDARCTTKLGRTLFADVTMGLSYEQDELQAGPMVNTTAEQVATPSSSSEPSAKAQAALDRIKPTRRTDLADDYTPADDLAVLANSGQDWWDHAGAQVSRRNTLQLAADRIAKWVSDHPDQDQVPLPPTEGGPVAQRERAEEVVSDAEQGEDVVDAELVEDEPDDAVPADPEPAAEPDTMDPADPTDPWAKRDDEPADELPADVPGADQLPGDELPDDGPELEAAPDLAPDPAELLAQIDAAAEELGKSRVGLMVRWVAVHRKNPEDATAEELQEFLTKLQPALDAARQG